MFLRGEWWSITDRQKGNFILAKIHFFARVRKNGFLGLTRRYLKIDQMGNIWWNNSITSGVRAFTLNLSSTGRKQQTAGNQFSKLLGRDENYKNYPTFIFCDELNFSFPTWDQLKIMIIEYLQYTSILVILFHLVSGWELKV